MGQKIGIDLGTSNSCMAYLEAGKPVVIANSEGARTTPSVVAWGKDGQTIVGSAAKRQYVTNKDRTFASVKRHMGTDWKTPEVDGKTYSPQEIGAQVLMRLKKDAETFLGEEVTDAVITVPAYFDDAQRTATKDAGAIAGLNVLRIINEPTSAALAYHVADEGDSKILIYDLGGGTMDASVLEVGDGIVEVLATSGDNQLGGDDWDNAIAEWIIKEFKKENPDAADLDITAQTRVLEAAEAAKKELSNSPATTISLPYLAMSTAGAPLSFDKELNQTEFEALTEGLLERTREPVMTALSDANLKPQEIDQIILVGGSTRMPAVSELIQEIFNKEGLKTVNPDEIVAMGAALQTGIIDGQVKDVVLVDVTPLSLGIESSGGMMVKIIEKNSKIPTRASKTFSTAVDNQSSVGIQVFQGERLETKYNKKLGQFDLTGILPAPAGVPQIEVTFALDANGVVTISAKDLASNTEQKVVVTGGSNLSPTEVERMRKDAEEHAAADEEYRLKLANEQAAQSGLRSTKKLLSQYKDKLPEDVVEKNNAAMETVESALNSGSSLDEPLKQLSEANSLIGSHLYA